MQNKFTDTKAYTVSDFLSWFDKKEIELSPKYQRSDVWDIHAKSYFIDSLIRGMPIPPIFIRLKPIISESKIIKEVIDGQQRLRAIFDFYNNRVSILPSHSEKSEKATYEELSHDEQENFFLYDIPVQIVKTERDDLIYDMFSRLNSNNFTLNKQELRNAKYWGEFKSIVALLSTHSRTAFIENGVFKDKQLSRMKDCEFVGHLLVFILSGVTDGKDGTLERHYKEYDKNEIECNIAKSKYLNTFDNIIEVIASAECSYFSRPVYFYTLFVVLHDTNTHIERAIEKVRVIENKIEALEEGQMLDEDYKWIEEFFNHHRRHTTDKIQRLTRVNLLKGFFVQ